MTKLKTAYTIGLLFKRPSSLPPSLLSYRHPHQVIHHRQQLRHVRDDVVNPLQPVRERRGGVSLVVGEEGAYGGEGGREGGKGDGE